MSTMKNFYVGQNGNDSNDGSIINPWKTIQHALSTVVPSALYTSITINVEPGTYNQSLHFVKSGLTACPIILAGQTGATIDGTNLKPSQTQGLLNITNLSNITIQGFTICNYTTNSASVVPAGIFISGGLTNVNILNNEIYNITTTLEKNGNAFGIAVYGTNATTPISNVTINNNNVHNNKTGNSETITVNGNVVGYIISNNIIHDNDNIGIDSIGFEGTCPNPVFDYARNGHIFGNTVYNISGSSNPGENYEYDADGIYVDGGSNIIIERNCVYNCDIGIEVASEHKNKVSSNVFVRDNVIYSCALTGISFGGYSQNVGGTVQCYFVNNTLYNNNTLKNGTGEISINYNAVANIVQNNIIYANSQSLCISAINDSSLLALNNNIYFCFGQNIKFQWNKKTYSNLSAFQNISNMDTQSQYLDPKFVVNGINFNIQLTSPALNAGCHLGTQIVGTLDVAGNPRLNTSGTTDLIDIGAYQLSK